MPQAWKAHTCPSSLLTTGVSVLFAQKTLGRKRAHKGSFKDDPRFYQEIRERGLTTSQESDDDLLDEPGSPEGARTVGTPIVVKNFRAPQVTWSQLPEVVELGILDTLPAEERKRQEAIFEILTSEFSYQHSLGILVTEFLQSRELRATMTQTEHHHLFSNILDVQGASQRFFEDLERRHKAQVCVEDISDILAEHAERHFHPYVAYCSNEGGVGPHQQLQAWPVGPGLDGCLSVLQSLPLISASRWRLKRGELFVVEEAGLFRKLASRPTCHLFLFNDVLVVTKKKSEDSFVVQDYAHVDHLQVQKVEATELPLPGGVNRSSSVPHLFQVTLLHNSEGRQERILLSSDSASDRARWITALTYREQQWLGLANKGGERSPQEQGSQPPFLPWWGRVREVPSILRPSHTRLRDGETGWFPEDFVQSITNRVAVEGNMRRMERLRVETDV
ncbi:PREDICTED: rho guanine nucleotide exchange factor 16 [Myotis davidii]|uniref:rho guanine nucleotide exchange factor 16 n=1 Tax=Myotis davidii TaxID=225400 RepID=UPI0007672E61|nr:PREDICTED: rho guanine nucleotide exchange factor 16 [Myotis davidii]